MEEDKILPHVENLVPGFVTLAAIALTYPGISSFASSAPLFAAASEQTLLVALVDSALAYLVGTIVFVASRLVVDTLSSLTFRWVLLRLLNGNRFRGKGRADIEKIYHATLAKARALPEIEQRRRRGRLIRTAVVPVVICTMHAAQPAAATAIGVLGVVMLYSYSEVAIFQEAALAG